jgi:glycosyltransferase involved in cell wall biosynthesis
MNKILLWSDVKGWAFDKTADMIIKHLPDMDITKYNGPDLNPDKLAKYDRIHAFNWLYGQKYAHRKGFSAGVAAHGYALKWHEEAKRSIPEFSKVVAISRELYNDISLLNPNTYYIPNAVDETIFQPRTHEGDFTVGWCGQKSTGGFGEKKGKEGRPKYDIKGYELILQPLMEALKGKVKFKINCRNHKNALSRKDMAEWYKDIDCFICTSLFEGGPFPVLEASASGKAVISTTVGIVPELIQQGYNGYLIEKPMKREDLPDVINRFKQCIKYLKKERDWCVLMGGNNRREILKEWTWKKVSPAWKGFFE